MKYIIIISIYIVGAILCYVVLRRSMKKEFGEWTNGDRRRSLAISCSSWVGLVVVLVVNIRFTDENKPASW